MAQGKKAKRDLNYYASWAMSRAERLELSRAGERTGLDDEIALLRLRLKEAMEAPPEDKRARRDVRMLTETLWVLLKAVSVQHKVSPGRRRIWGSGWRGRWRFWGTWFCRRRSERGDWWRGRSFVLRSWFVSLPPRRAGTMSGTGLVCGAQFALWIPPDGFAVRLRPTGL